jgi:TRAP-type C4-dicarboxylate transport system permease small subunit
MKPSPQPGAAGPRGRLRPVAARFARHMAVGLIGTMFVCFLLQICFRYVLNQPLGWTEEVTILCWVWVVLWTAAFVLSDDDEVRFDLVYAAVPERVRAGFTVVTSIAIVVLLLISLPATWRYVAFMKREHSAYLRVPFSYLYSIYVAFLLAVALRHVLLLLRAVRRLRAPTPPTVVATSESGNA